MLDGVLLVLLEVLDDKLVLLLVEVDVLLGCRVGILLQVFGTHLVLGVKLLASGLLSDFNERVLNEVRL